jgi:hypothetical protein
MDDSLQMLMRIMLLILVPIGLRSLSGQSATPTPVPTPRHTPPFQLPPRRRIRRNRVEFRSLGVQQAAPPIAPSSHPMWDRWLDPP